MSAWPSDKPSRNCNATTSCPNVATAREMCGAHYRKWWRAQHPPQARREELADLRGALLPLVREQPGQTSRAYAYGFKPPAATHAVMCALRGLEDRGLVVADRTGPYITWWPT